MYSFSCKSKCKGELNTVIICCALILLASVRSDSSTQKCYVNTDCNGNGECVDGSCICDDGWKGTLCQFCGGKIRLHETTGTLFDGRGNYSVETLCTWLIQASNSTIVFRLEEFETECGWDHLYIFDGDSTDGPLLAAFSGAIYKDNSNTRKILEVKAASGSALVHFSSDIFYTMAGFNLTYRLYPKMTTSHFETFQNNCSESNNCSNDFPTWSLTASNSNHTEKYGSWEVVPTQGLTPLGTASHTAMVWGKQMCILWGAHYNKKKVKSCYDFVKKSWNVLHYSNGSSIKYGHSSVLYHGKIYLYGGFGIYGPSSHLWTFDMDTGMQERVSVQKESCKGYRFLCKPLKVAGHTAISVTNQNNTRLDRMIVLFGYSPDLGFVNTIQEFYFESQKWLVVNSTGYLVKGRYGHTASWDQMTKKIYVYGGYVPTSPSTYTTSKNLYSYEPDSRVWTLLSDAPSATFLHTATFVSPGFMLTFGGNTFSDIDSKCYSSEVLIYDVVCDSWRTISVPAGIQSDASRYGHSAVLYDRSLYIYGGFNGQMLSNILRYSPEVCESFVTQESCSSTKISVRCMWNKHNNNCLSIGKLYDVSNSEHEEVMLCPKVKQNGSEKEEFCKKFEDCSSCTQTNSYCVWCGNKHCLHHSECKKASIVSDSGQCPIDVALICKQIYSCVLCNAESFCKWKEDKCNTITDLTNIYGFLERKSKRCQKACSKYKSCLNCTQHECIWCQNKERCVERNAYVSSFPYGQCMRYSIDANMCSRSNESMTRCNLYSTCKKCTDDPACGWCDYGSGTGLGKCALGGNSGPSSLEPTCSPVRWHFVTCPACQCNGHSKCRENICEICENFTTGSNCEKCIPGYWGDPQNGVNCQPCDCNDQATYCHSETGHCYCTTKGIIGNHCEKCDNLNHYYGNPANNESCYYELTTNYQFTFNLSKESDRVFNQIKFRNSPIEDIDADLFATCSRPAKINITIKAANSKHDKILISGANCTDLKMRLSNSEYTFGMEGNVSQTVINAHVYDFQPPLLIRISVAQYPK